MSNKGWTLLFGLAVVLLLLTVLISGQLPFLSPIDSGFTRANDTGYTETGVSRVVEANNQFTFELYQQLEGQAEGNIFFSPWSISAASAMLYEGARGNTAQEISQVLGFPWSAATRRSSFAHLHNLLNSNKDYRLSTANALWAQKDHLFLDKYVNTLEQFYAAKATNLDFKKNTEQSRQTINSWVEKQTQGKIEDLFTPNSINPLTRLVLTNAVYFKGDWVEQFKEKLTEEENFYTSHGKVKVPMMRHEDEKDFNYTETGKLKVLELPYKGQELAMLILLPHENYTLQDLSLTADHLESLHQDLREQEVKVYLPKYKLETKYKLEDYLKDMGMPSAFDPDQADLSGMDKTNKLFVSAVVHQAFVEVNEEGTEAAAATGVPVATRGMPQYKTFRADHPFIFLIEDRRTGNILFLGRVVDPSAR